MANDGRSLGKTIGYPGTDSADPASATPSPTPKSLDQGYDSLPMPTHKSHTHMEDQHDPKMEDTLQKGIDAVKKHHEDQPMDQEAPPEMSKPQIYKGTE